MDRPVRTKSRLESLPVEVQENILSYLIGSLSCYNVSVRPKNPEELQTLWHLNWNRDVLVRHPFYQLAATCHIFRQVVESFCHHLLTKYQGILVFPVPKELLTTTRWRDIVRQRVTIEARYPGSVMDVDPPFRLMWVRSVYCRCMFCGRITKRRAIFNYLIWVCNKCDQEQWPKMVNINTLLHNM
jgi:hypothetical protein